MHADFGLAIPRGQLSYSKSQILYLNDNATSREPMLVSSSSKTGRSRLCLSLVDRYSANFPQPASTSAGLQIFASSAVQLVGSMHRYWMGIPLLVRQYPRIWKPTNQSTIVHWRKDLLICCRREDPRHSFTRDRYLDFANFMGHPGQSSKAPSSNFHHSLLSDWDAIIDVHLRILMDLAKGKRIYLARAQLLTSRFINRRSGGYATRLT